MTKINLYTVRDAKAECYLPPFTMRTNAEALRAFADSVAKPGTTIHDHPGDFFLYLIGEFDQQCGFVVPCDLVSLASGLDFVAKEDTDE